MGPSSKQTSVNDKLFMSGLAATANVAPSVPLVRRVLERASVDALATPHKCRDDALTSVAPVQCSPSSCSCGRLPFLLLPSSQVELTDQSHEAIDTISIL